MRFFALHNILSIVIDLQSNSQASECQLSQKKFPFILMILCTYLYNLIYNPSKLLSASKYSLWPSAIYDTIRRRLTRRSGATISINVLLIGASYETIRAHAVARHCPRYGTRAYVLAVDRVRGWCRYGRSGRRRGRSSR